jgi:hypothetical protein
VSTADQNLDRQLTATTDYAQDELGAGLDWLEWARDVFTLQGKGEIVETPPAGGAHRCE